ncbi:hypothetical protein SAMN06265222_113111 [Neorhodopirellula lusitana]|uniref:Uncharacterized protein n=1 Tax=Neorhodopirellula lusitana TaxID=445327 RepID=A0ABY1QJR8_9BACT|nr:hypothetical protein [Neorhodopirellula lusitana]SMP70711.1 hypothetical protein SAMN06265222_113111 [Neorhodopirellula lusitana]
MSSGIFIYAPSKEVHSDDAIEFVVTNLENLFKTQPDTDEVFEALRTLGEWAKLGGLNPKGTT